MRLLPSAVLPNAVRLSGQAFNGIQALRLQVLLPPAALHRRQLPDVLGGGGEEPQAGRLLRHARGAGHEDQDRHPGGQEGPGGSHGVPAGAQPSLVPVRPPPHVVRLCVLSEAQQETYGAFP